MFYERKGWECHLPGRLGIPRGGQSLSHATPASPPWVLYLHLHPGPTGSALLVDTCRLDWVQVGEVETQISGGGWVWHLVQLLGASSSAQDNPFISDASTARAQLPPAGRETASQP